MRDRLAVLSQLVALVVSGRSWWLAPVLIGLAIVAIFTVVAIASPISPFLYPFF